MKIGILTVPFNNNYGGFLQAYALKKVLSDMGHDVIFINRRRNKPKGVKACLKELLIFCHLITDKNAEIIEKISIYTNLFKSKYLEPITEEYYSTAELKKCINIGVDCFVVGSDQVWRYKYAKDSIDDFFFSFLRGTKIPRFSYAASMGTEEMEYPEDKLRDCSDLLREFKAVSVRERSTLRLLSERFNCKNAQLVLDPTMLLCSEDYKTLFKGIRPSTDASYVFTYILDDSEVKEAIIDHVMNNRKINRVNMKAQTGELNKQGVIEPVEQWLSDIYHSDFVVTDSFHGTVFSIIFKKQFVVIGNPQRGMVRITDLLNSLGLANRLIINTEEIDNLFNEDIDWLFVKDVMQKESLKSLSFLREVLS